MIEGIDGSYKLTKNIALWEFMEGSLKNRAVIPERLIRLNWEALDKEKLDNAKKICSMIQELRNFYVKQFPDIVYICTCGARALTWELEKGRSGLGYHDDFLAIDGYFCRKVNGKYIMVPTLMEQLTKINSHFKKEGGRAINVAQNFIHLDAGPFRTWSY
jgi:hypothetical protein